MTAYDRNPDPQLNVSCHVQGIDATGGIPYDVWLNTSGSAVGQQVITGPVPPPTVTFFAAFCIVPPRSDGDGAYSFLTGFSVD